MYKYIIKILKLILPLPIINLLVKISLSVKSSLFQIKLQKVRYNHRNALKKVREKVKRNEKVKVVFFFLNTDSWKYDSLINYMKMKEIFDVVVVIIPFISKGKSFLINELNENINYCKNKNYNYLIGYDIINDKSKDIKKLLKPDIVFFSNPNNLTTENFLISNFKDTLTCYMSYSIRVSTNYQYEYNTKLQNSVWINFCESEIHYELTRKHSLTKGKNCTITGYPVFEKYQQKYVVKNVWKKQNKMKYRIIWAPHWTIPGFVKVHNWSCFLDYHEQFIKLADEFEDDIQFAIKPHPFLRNVLEDDNLWGKKKTDEYFMKWNKMPNTQICTGDYSELFLESDALIHDSGGFMAEYLMMNKPVAYTLNNRDVLLSYNEYGQKALMCHEIVKNDNQLIEFISNVINKHDSKKHIKEQFVNKYLIINNKIASENIINAIDKKIK